MSVKISAVIITFNEEKNIFRCLSSLKPVADDIVVIDSCSKDQTKDICLKAGVRFIERPFTTHIDQKNYALTQTQYDHVLSLDADEYLSPELAESIKEVKKSWPFEAYVVKRLSSYGGKWINYGNWRPDKKIRLWNKKVGQWGGQNPHDIVVLYNGTKTHTLKGDLLHQSYQNATETLHKIQRYSTIYAQENKGKKSCSLFTIITHSAYSFLKSYVFKMGVLDGYEGFIVAVAMANHTFYKYVKLHEANQELKKRGDNPS